MTAPASHSSRSRHALHLLQGIVRVTVRMLGAIGGGYALSAALVALGAVALSLYTPLSRGEATILMAMLGFLIYLGWLIWAFGERRLWLVWLVLSGGVAGSYGLLHTLTPLLGKAVAGGG